LIHVEGEASRTGSLVFTDPNVLVKLECLEKENTTLKLDLSSCLKELQIKTIESKKKVTKPEVEYQKLQALAFKSSLLSDQRSYVVSSFSIESFTNGQSNSGD
ncbi:hypothetical protein H5410_050979, partial [Solanum commersonii]